MKDEEGRVEGERERRGRNKREAGKEEVNQGEGDKRRRRRFEEL